MTGTKELVMQYFTVLNTHDPDAWAAVAADDIVYHVPNGTFEGKAAVAAYLQTIWSAFHPVYDLDSISVFTGDDPGVAAITWNMETTFANAYEGAPPTGKTATSSGMDVVEFNDEGLLTGLTMYYDTYSVWEQYGLVPKVGSTGYKAIVMAEIAAGKTKEAAGKAKEAMHL
jgi:steroid delta-isomerase-like uncharacterized protein